MTGKKHLWPEDRVIENGLASVSAILELPNRVRTRFWYRVSEEHATVLAQGCDPFVVAAIFSIMSQGKDCIVHGQVSPSLLRNLGEFQAL